jgi:hypothetical protein
MARTLWIVGLVIALLVYGGFSVIGIVALVSHRHLNEKGVVILLSDGYVTWITFRYLLFKIRRSEPIPSSNKQNSDIELPRLV